MNEENVKRSYEDAMQRAADIKNLTESRGWKILEEEISKRKDVEMQSLLSSKKYSDMLSSQALLKAYDYINEIIRDLLLAGENAEYEIKLVGKRNIYI